MKLPFYIRPRGGRTRRRTAVLLILTLMLTVLAQLPNNGWRLLAPRGASADGLQTAKLIADGVIVTVQTPYLPSTSFNNPDPGDYNQWAISASAQPYEEFSVIAAPFGYQPPTEAAPVAQSGGSAGYRAAMLSYRSDQGEVVQTDAAGPTATIFGQQTVGQVSLVNVPITSDTPVPLVTVEWVVEAGKRLWIVRVSQEQPPNTAALASASAFVDSLNSVVLTSTTLNNPTTLAPDYPPTTIGDPAQDPTNLPFPSWWNGNCDYRNFAGSYPLGASYLGMPACGPRNTLHVVRFFPGAWGEYEWQCVELSMRYMYQRWGIAPYQADGFQVVSHYQTWMGGNLQKIPNGGAAPAPVAGDVLSYGTTSPGHTSVVTSSNVDSNGNGTIWVIQQNASSNGWGTLTVRNWYVWGGVTRWLHHP